MDTDEDSGVGFQARIGSAAPLINKPFLGRWQNGFSREALELQTGKAGVTARAFTGSGKGNLNL
jgi:hypothetical protein